ncbi:MAG: cyclic pyranopterin monophosphate synthase MoaC [Archaeoglobaceae archaeon]
MKLTHISDGKVRMVDVSEKEDVARRAIAEGFIRLRRETLELIRRGEVEKGNVFAVASVAAVMAAKKTPELIPLCHPLPLTSVKVDFDILDDGVKVTCEVRATAKTGVEMEALTAASAALLAIWDMVKSAEKDESGNYPFTRIEYVRVVEKVKG